MTPEQAERIIAWQQRAIDNLRFTMRQAADDLDGKGLGVIGVPVPYANVIERVQAVLREKATYYQPGGTWSQKGAEHVEAEA